MRWLLGLAICGCFLFSPQLQAGSKEEEVAKYLADFKSKDPAARKRAAEEIGKIGQIKASAAKPALKPMLELLADKDADVRGAAALSLARLDEPSEVVPALAKMLKEEKESKVKMKIANGLGLMGEASKEALPALKSASDAAKKADDKPLGRAITDAVRQINNRPKK